MCSCILQREEEGKESREGQQAQPSFPQQIQTPFIPPEAHPSQALKVRVLGFIFAATCHATGSNLCYPACLCMCLGSSMSLSCPGAHIATRGSFHEVVALWPMVKVQP